MVESEKLMSSTRTLLTMDEESLRVMAHMFSGPFQGGHRLWAGSM